jgi:segregation and condensation protein B
MPPSNLRSAVEALLFASDQPLTLLLLAEALEAEPAEVSEALKSLGETYADREAGVELREMAGGWLFTTAPGQAEWVTRMLRGKRRMRLSRAALETMAIIAYKQPVTKSEVEAIRGVDASGVLATLLERNLVTIKGRSTVVGRPLLYGTTHEFLNYFGLRDLSELPRPEELRALVAAREPEQLEMLEMDPASGMPLALASGEAQANGDEPSAEGGVAVAGEVSAAEDPDAFSLEDADAAIAQAKAARAEAALAMSRGDDDFAGTVPAEAADDASTDEFAEADEAGEEAAAEFAEEDAGDTMLAGAGDLDESSDEDEDEDEYDDEDDDEDEYDEDEEDEDEEDGDLDHPSATLAPDDGRR